MRIIACVNADGNLAGFQPPKRDLQRFAALTIGGVVIMGRKTWEALPDKARPLPHRQNAIATNCDVEEFEKRYPAGVWRFQGWGAMAYRNAWVIGGGEFYAASMDFAEYVYLSQTADRGGSVPFPMPRLHEFKRLVRQDHGDHTFEIYGRTL